LGVADVKNKLRAGVEVFILRLDDLVCLLRVPRTSSVKASLPAKGNRLQESEDVREYQHGQLSEDD